MHARAVTMRLEALVLVAATSVAMGVLSLQATSGGQMGQVAAMATAMAMAAMAEQNPCAATVEAAGPEALLLRAAVLMDMEVLPLL